MTALLMLAAGGAGALARHELSGWVHRRSDTTRPWGTAVVNLLGVLVLSAVVVAVGRGLLDARWQIVLGAGFSAGFTTFSTWMVEAVHLARDGGWAGRRAALVDVVGQLMAGVLLAALVLAVW